MALRRKSGRWVPRCFVTALLAVQIALSSVAQAQTFSTPGAEKYALGGQLRAPLRFREADLRIPQVELDAQFEALSKATNVSKISYHPNGVPRQVFADLPIVLSVSDDIALMDREVAPVLEELRPILLLTGAETFRLKLRERTTTGGITLGFVQEIRGLPVIPSGLRLSSSRAPGTISALSATLLLDRDLPSEPKIARAQAESIALKEFQRSISKDVALSSHRSTELAYMLMTDTMAGHLGWRVYLRSTADQRAFTLDVDALTGAPLRILIADNSIRVVPDRRIFLNGGSQPVIVEGQTSGNPNVTATYNHLGETFAHFANRRGWYGMGGFANHPEDGDVEVQGVAAMWSPYYTPPRVRFGPASGARMAWGNALDVVAHEFSHGVFYARSGLSGAPDAESGGIIEGLADLGGIWVSADSASFPDYQHRWVTGRLWPSTPGKGLRSASWPRDPLMDDMNPYVAAVDWYGDRIGSIPFLGDYYANATLLTHAYYILVESGMHSRVFGQTASGGTIPSIAVSPIPSTIAAQIFWNATASLISYPSPTFFDLRDETVVAAQAFGSSYAQSVANAWLAVGVGYGCSGPPALPTLQVIDHYCQGMYDFHWDPVPGATKYTLEYSTYSNFFVASTAADGWVHQCPQSLPGPGFVRLRACNGCGCSSWTTRSVRYYVPCL